MPCCTIAFDSLWPQRCSLGLQQQQQHQLISIALPLPQLLIASVAATILQATTTTQQQHWLNWIWEECLARASAARRCGAVATATCSNQQHLQKCQMISLRAHQLQGQPGSKQSTYSNPRLASMPHAPCPFLASLLLLSLGHALNNFTLCLPSRRMQMR